MKLKIFAVIVSLLIFCGCASYKYQAPSCQEVEQYRGYSGPYCSPSPRP